MKAFRMLALLLAFWSCGAVLAGTETKGTWELGPYVGAGFPDDYNPADLKDINLLVGARLGYFLTEQFSLEGSYHRQFAEADDGTNVPMDAGRLNALWNFRPGQVFRPFITVGGGMERVGGGIDEWDPAPNAGLGMKWIVSEFGGLRIDGRYIPVRVKIGTDNSWQNNFEGALSFFMLFGAKAEEAPVVETTPAPEPQKVEEAPPVVGDADKDGVLDNEDKCPDTVVGAMVDESGCPKDTDGDGIFDGLDKCPATPKKTKIDEMGCPLVSKARGALKGVTFNSGKATLTEGSKIVLDGVAQTLKEFPDVNVEVQGHTDNTGNSQLNMTLSEERATAVREYLISKGVDSTHLSSHGYGDTKPVADNNTSAGRKQNRRVELNWLDKPKTE